ncbi:MAG: RNA 3'-terminal phosphate cyclase, partial [Candidatus Omnitrophica bacterium]|nr:RNA 3'-terminal phosphate cyclase [Candidatus Omnitrophota bacterium]
MLTIDGSYGEGGGQIVRTTLALSTILSQPVMITNIRKARKNPGLAEQHLRGIEAFKNIFGATCEGDRLGSCQIIFYPRQEVTCEHVVIAGKTAASIGLIIQALAPALCFLHAPITLQIHGGTAGKWAPPVEFYPQIIFPFASIKADVQVTRRGYYPQGGGSVSVSFKKFALTRIELLERQALEEIKITSFASETLKDRRVAERQSLAASDFLKDNMKVPLILEEEEHYCDTLSVGSEIQLCATFVDGSRLWADGLGEISKKAEDVGKDAAVALLATFQSTACCDVHAADNLIPYLAFVGGQITTSAISEHILTNIWVCEQFLGEIFEVN